MEDSEFGENRSNWFGETNEEEAAFYFSLNDFDQIVEKYGVIFVMEKMKQETREDIFKYFIAHVNKR